MTHFERLIHRSADRHIPLEVVLELTHRCNFRCQHCYIPDHQRPDGLTTKHYLSLLDELVDLGTLYLAFSGGECLLRHDWKQIAARARQLGFSLALLSNGSLIDRATARDLADLQVYVEISYYADDEKVFDAITRRPGSFEQTRRGIALLADFGIPMKLNVPVMTLNRMSYASAIAYAERIGAEWSALPKVVSRKDGNPAPTRFRLNGDELTHFFATTAVPADSDQDCDSRTTSDSMTLCAAGIRYANITSSGDVLPCNIMPIVAGNIRQKTFADIWHNSPRLQQLRSIRRDDLAACSSCPDFAACGRCPAQALVEDGDLLGPSRDACTHTRARRRARVDIVSV